MKKKKVHRVLVLLDKDLMPPDTLVGQDDKDIEKWRMEFDVISTLRKQGHDVVALGVTDDLSVIRKAVEEHKPHVACNLLEEFAQSATMVQNIVGFLELLRVPYTGCNPRGLMIALDKTLSKKILVYHRIAVPQLATFPKSQRIRKGLKLKYPMLVKAVRYEGSVGISQASVVYDEQHLIERVEFIHRTVDDHAMAEEYIEGREIYVGVMGNSRLETFTPWELLLKNLPEGAPNIATRKVKWDLAYQKRAGVVTQAAGDLPPEQLREIDRVSKRIYRLLNLSGYARLDFRLRADGALFLIEANPNPNMRVDEDFAASALHSGLNYQKLWARILGLAMTYEYISLP